MPASAVEVGVALDDLEQLMHVFLLSSRAFVTRP